MIKETTGYTNTILLRYKSLFDWLSMYSEAPPNIQRPPQLTEPLSNTIEVYHSHVLKIVEWFLKTFSEDYKHISINLHIQHDNFLTNNVSFPVWRHTIVYHTGNRYHRDSESFDKCVLSLFETLCYSRGWTRKWRSYAD